MKFRSRSSLLSWASSIGLIAAVVLLTLQLVVYSRSRANFPAGLIIADVPVGGLSRQQAAERLLEVYSMPVELDYDSQLIHMDPSIVDFDLDLESMIAAGDLQRTGGSFWGGFWDYLWGNRSEPASVPLDAQFSEEALRGYLNNEIATRYDRPAAPAIPVPGTTGFSQGEPGTTINTEAAVARISNAIFSPSDRTVNLPLQQAEAPRPNMRNLQIQLEQIMDLAGYDGLADIYIQDLKSFEELHFIYQLGENLITEPDATFTAASVIKIPILVSIYARLDEAPDPIARELLSEMIIQSFNEPADQLLQNYVDAVRAPLIVTEDMQALGLENTFLAGHFYLGAPLLALIDTPAQDRVDIFTDPDVYNQTTPLDMGMLLSDIYQCAETGGGALVAVYGDNLTQNECREIINLLSLNQLGILLEAGVPEGTRVAHKHGWVTNPNTGVINTIGDAGLIFTPNGDYVVSIFLFQPVQLIWEPISNMFGDLSEAIYNYFTLPSGPNS
ncbi:MAG: serine hydrolase [Chloroflexi bacterium]|nr:serine hydrolase [Chloroflexota bacterium]